MPQSLLRCVLSGETLFTSSRGSEKILFFFQKAQPTGFWGFIGVWALLGFQIFFHLNEQLGSLLVDSAYQLSFYLDSPVL